VAGALIGVSLPFFRNRLIAGMVVAVAASSGLPLAWWGMQDPLPPEGVLFVGAMCGFVYAMLLWEYDG